MRKLLNLSLALLGLAYLLHPAFAQSGAGCSIANEKPSIITGTSHTLALADQCHPLIFTAATAVTVTMPNAAVTFPQGFRVYIKAQGAGTVTLGTPTTSKIDGVAGPVSYTTGTGAELWSDGTDYYTGGLGIKNP